MAAVACPNAGIAYKGSLTRTVHDIRSDGTPDPVGREIRVTMDVCPVCGNWAQLKKDGTWGKHRAAAAKLAALALWAKLDAESGYVR